MGDLFFLTQRQTSTFKKVSTILEVQRAESIGEDEEEEDRKSNENGHDTAKEVFLIFKEILQELFHSWIGLDTILHNGSFHIPKLFTKSSMRLRALKKAELKSKFSKYFT